jgi:four helix bundle protein
MPLPRTIVLEHEKLSVYHKSLDLSSLVALLCEAWPIGKHFLLDQLLRASTSVVLNIAEGAGEHAPREKARFYRMSLRSSTECSAIFDVALRHRAVTEQQRDAARAMIFELVAMLTTLAANFSSGDGARSGYQKFTRPPVPATLPAPNPGASTYRKAPSSPEPFGRAGA